MNFAINDYIDVSKFDEQFVKNIKMVFAFNLHGYSGSETLIVSKDDKVLAFGANKKGCLGVNHTSPVSEPTIVPNLCDKQVTNFAVGFRHLIAVTKYGSIYSWGFNGDGELGNGSVIDSLLPETISFFDGTAIADVCCGGFHTLALTQSGDVYAWGYNRYGQVGDGSTVNKSLPIKVSGLYSAKIVGICCGSYHSTALTESGNVFVWGYNQYGQLGTGAYNDKYTPVCLVIKDVSISKVMCGALHSVLLASSGDVYAFGCNYYGQIGNGSKRHQNCAVKINSGHKFADIAAVNRSDVSIGVTVGGTCFVWGHYNAEVIVQPKQTEMRSIRDVFASFSCLNMNHKHITI